jgi:hypothetical protein
LPDESDEAARFRLPRPQRGHGKIVGGSTIRKPIKHPVEERRAVLQQALPRSPVRRSVGGSPGVRQRLRAPRKWIVEFRLRASNWPCSQREWIGTFDTEEEAKFAYDAAQHFLGKPTYYFDYPPGFFERCSPRVKGTPLTKDFVAFVKKKANQYAMHDRELQPNVLISEERTLTNRLLVLAGDGEESGATSDIQVGVVTSAAAGAGRPRGPAALEVTSLSLSADSELVSDPAVEVTQPVCNNPLQTTPDESTSAEDGVNRSDSDGLPSLAGLDMYVCSQDEISEIGPILIAGFDYELNGVSTPEGASQSIVPSLERPFPGLTTHNQFRKESFGCGENSDGVVQSAGF